MIENTVCGEAYYLMFDLRLLFGTPILLFVEFYFLFFSHTLCLIDGLSMHLLCLP